MKTKTYNTKQDYWKQEINKMGDFLLDIKPMMKIEDEAAIKIFDEGKQKVLDEWLNTVGSIGANNSITQYNQFILNRLAYAECSNLATDGIIHNAISKHTNECFRRGYKIKLEDLEDALDANDIIKMLEKKIKKHDVIPILRKAFETALVYGNALVYFNFNSEDLSKPIHYDINVMSENPLNNITIVSPFLAAPNKVNMSNPLQSDYMKPELYFITGSSATVHSSRTHNLVIFDVPDLIKPIYNFGGLSICQFMKDPVGLYETNRKSQGEIALRFKTMMIKTEMVKTNPEDAKCRAKYIAMAKNNDSVILLGSEEEYIETITPLTGLDAIGQQLMQNVGVYSLLAINTLFGTTPSGLNSTGAFELKTQYNQTQNMQNNIIKPLFEKILRIFCLEEKLDLYPIVEFNELDTNAQLELAQVHKSLTEIAAANTMNGIWTNEQAFNYLQQNDVINQSETFEEPDIVNYEEPEVEERLDL